MRGRQGGQTGAEILSHWLGRGREEPQAREHGTSRDWEKQESTLARASGRNADLETTLDF